MNIKFYRNKSDSRCLNKELSNETVINFNIRNDVDVHEFDVITSDTRPYLNYAYIEDFNRYYYVNEIKLNDTLRRLHFKCDVLMSFAETINNLDIIVKRSASNYNGYLNDNEFQAYSYEEIVCKDFPHAMDLDSIILMTIG